MEILGTMLKPVNVGELNTLNFVAYRAGGHEKFPELEAVSMQATEGGQPKPPETPINVDYLPVEESLPLVRELKDLAHGPHQGEANLRQTAGRYLQEMGLVAEAA